MSENAVSVLLVNSMPKAQTPAARNQDRVVMGKEIMTRGRRNSAHTRHEGSVVVGKERTRRE